MAEVVWDENAQAQAAKHEQTAPGAAELIVGVVGMLSEHPLLGRRGDEGFRELVISRGKTGYVALYRYDEPLDAVFVLAVRHQREAGFSS